MTSTPPYDHAAELALLGALVTFPDRTLEPVIATGIDARHFYVPGIARAFDAIREMHDAGEPVDAHTVAAKVTDRDVIAEAIATAADSLPAHAPAWARTVMDYAKARAMLPPLRAAARAAEDGRPAVVFELIHAVLDAGEVADHVCR